MGVMVDSNTLGAAAAVVRAFIGDQIQQLGGQIAGIQTRVDQMEQALSVKADANQAQDLARTIMGFQARITDIEQAISGKVDVNQTQDLTRTMSLIQTRMTEIEQLISGKDTSQIQTRMEEVA